MRFVIKKLRILSKVGLPAPVDLRPRIPSKNWLVILTTFVPVYWISENLLQSVPPKGLWWSKNRFYHPEISQKWHFLQFSDFSKKEKEELINTTDESFHCGHFEPSYRCLRRKMRLVVKKLRNLSKVGLQAPVYVREGLRSKNRLVTLTTFVPVYWISEKITTKCPPEG